MKTSLMTAKRSFAAILLCLAAVFAGCKGGEDVPKPDPKDGTVSVTGTAVVGQTLTANSVQADFPFTGDFTWESSASGAAAATDWTPISGATGENKNQLTLTDSLKDKYVRATRTNSNNKKVSSDA
ncbi:MAG: hypothetical protein LBH00_09970, partial [Planctomycetaceae bacterium]|nr:hypothetical protein [Planctomycetaceae bacterium]